MNMKFKKITACLMATMSLVTGMVGMSASASYENTYITNFIAPPSVAGTYTPLPVTENGVRKKSTATSIYVKIDSSTYSVSVQTWGLSEENWSGGKNETLNASGSRTTGVTLNAWTRYRIKNMVNEDGYSYAGLKMCSTSQYDSSFVQGAWSPDYSPEAGVVLAG